MPAHFRVVIYLLLFSLLPRRGGAQCNPWFARPLSARPANYNINVKLDDPTQTVSAEQSLQFSNQSPEPVRSLRFYMYLNAFKNTESSFLKGTSKIFGQTYLNRDREGWGWIEVEHIERANGADLSGNMRYIQPDDGNSSDQSVLEVNLDKPLLPGETAVFNLKWRAKMPETIARAGHNGDFYLFCHWFPQLGVWEQNKAGKWDWNCHQFFRTTEFYADFGVYDVHVTTDKKFVMGASGCLLEEKDNGDGSVTRHYHVEDVIDFAWSIYPRFTVQEDRWNEVQIRLLIAPEHAAIGPRYIRALKFALEYLENHVGKYPYPGITVVDPPFHGLHSGLMEYPTLVTVGTFYGMPAGLHLTESLVVHEFVHQYFMGIVSSNEKEEAWLDEGFVTYFEDRIIDAMFGAKHGIVDVFGFCFDNRELTRTEYTTMANPREGIVARPGWMFNDHNFKSLIYSKTATTLRTVQELIGEERMDALVRDYFETWKFKHPKGPDFTAVLQKHLATLPDSIFGRKLYNLFENSIYRAEVLDYAVVRIDNEILPAPQGLFGAAANQEYRAGGNGKLHSSVEVQRKGEWVFPVELLVTFEDGSSQTLHWSGEEGSHVFWFEGPAKVLSAKVDPQEKIGLDVDLNNNSLSLQPDPTPLWKYAAKAVFWVQNLFQTLSFLM